MLDPQDAPPIRSATIPLKQVLTAISHHPMVSLARAGQRPAQLMVTERLGFYPDAISKAMSLLRESRIVLQGPNHLYQIAQQFAADKENRILAFGCCLVRVNVGREVS